MCLSGSKDFSLRTLLNLLFSSVADESTCTKQAPSQFESVPAPQNPGLLPKPVPPSLLSSYFLVPWSPYKGRSMPLRKLCWKDLWILRNIPYILSWTLWQRGALTPPRYFNLEFIYTQELYKFVYLLILRNTSSYSK